jgi:uncharacterized membrane protein HdeD (DUF308 family)
MSTMIHASHASATHEQRLNLRSAWWIFLTFGLLSVVLGFLAISATVIATMASVFVFGLLLLVEGVMELFHAVMVRNWKGLSLHLLAAALYLMVGLFILEDKIRAAEVLTLLLAAAFFVGGVLRIVFSLVERFPGAPWVVVTGVVNLALALLIWNHWPNSSLQVIGLFVGIDLLFHGWSNVILALSLRTYSEPRLA